MEDKVVAPEMCLKTIEKRLSDVEKKVEETGKIVINDNTEISDSAISRIAMKMIEIEENAARKRSR